MAKKFNHDYISLEQGGSTLSTISGQSLYESIETGVEGERGDDTEWKGWNNASGANVQGFIKRKLEDAVTGLKWDLTRLVLQGTNAFGQVVCEEQVTTAEPVYSYDANIVSVTVGSTKIMPDATTAQINYSSQLNTAIEVQLYSLMSLLNQEPSYSVTSMKYRLFWEGALSENSDLYNTTVVITQNSNLLDKTTVLVGKHTNAENDISRLFSKGFTNKKLYIQLLNPETNQPLEKFPDPVSFGNVKFTELLIVLKAPSNVLSIGDTAQATFKFNIEGLSSNLADYNFEYYDCFKGVTNDESVKMPLSSLTSHTLPLVAGAHYLLARVVNKNNSSIASEWINANLLAQDSTVKSAMAIISELPKEFRNNDTSKLYRVVTTQNVSGTINITAYLSDNDWGIEYTTPFNNFTITRTDQDPKFDQSYYTYVEMEAGSNPIKFAKFIIEYNNITEEIPLLEATANGETANVEKYHTIEIIEDALAQEYNLNLVPNASINFNQGNRGDLFDSGINPGLSSTDGWVTDTEVRTDGQPAYSYNAYKVSPVEGGLFASYDAYTNKIVSNPKKLLDNGVSLETNGEFTIELLIKSTNISDVNDEIMSIGNIKFYPGHLAIYVSEDDANNAGTDSYSYYESSRADYQLSTITHLTITYSTSYKPNTYPEFYDDLLAGYTQVNNSFKCLRVFVNGVINREIQVSLEQLINSNGLSLQINPKKSDVYLYLFRTYSHALNFSEVQRNYISSMLHFEDKIEFAEKNNILFKSGTRAGQISLKLAAKKYKTMVIIHPSDTKSKSNYEDRPQYWNNVKTSGINTSIFIHYPDMPEECGKLVLGKQKAQGSSAKKYLIHNVGYKKFKWIPELIDGESNPVYKDPLPSDLSTLNLESGFKNAPYASGVSIIEEPIKARSLVGKVNYASSMQSHKQGAIKLFNDAYANINSLTNLSDLSGGRKAVMEDNFLYFYMKSPNSSWDYTDSSGKVHAGANATWDNILSNEENVYFVGFQTFGSAKKDEPTSGYDKNITPEYLMFEGADNGNTGANFKVPWAAYLMWDDLTFNEQGQVTTSTRTRKQRTYAETNTDYNIGLNIQDETIQYQMSGADSLDVDFGMKAYTTPSGDESEFFYFNKNVINNTLPYFAKFANLIYLFDFSSYMKTTSSNTVDDPEALIAHRKGDNTSQINLGIVINDSNNLVYKKLVMPTGGAQAVYRYTKTEQVNGRPVTYTYYVDLGVKYSVGDVLRWDSEATLSTENGSWKGIWVPAGLHYEDGNWRTLNVANLFNDLTKLRKQYQEGSTETLLANLGSTIEEDICELFDEEDVFTIKNDGNYTYFSNSSWNALSTVNALDTQFKRALAEMFKATCKKYLDLNDVIYHQAFIRLVSGTDNRAKNTYYQIIGDKYIKNGNAYEKPAVSDPKMYKIRLLGDDLDTIFATDNNGQQVKPYNLLEPPFDKNNKSKWGDLESGLFYNFDIIFSEEINQMLGEIINYATGSSNFDASISKIHQYFLDVQRYFPAIAFNHHAEIFYELAQTIYSKGSLTSFGNRDGVLNTTSGTFRNNSVYEPLSLSHGSCLESELQFLQDRFTFLNTMVLKGQLSTIESPLISGTGGASGDLTILGKASYTQYLYPYIADIHIINQQYDDITQEELDYDVLFKSLYPSGNTTIIKQAQLNKTYDFSYTYSQTLAGTPAALPMSDKYQSLQMIEGLQRISSLLYLPNALSFEVPGNYVKQATDDGGYIEYLDGNTAGYSLSDNNIKVSEFLPSVETLKLIGVPNTSGSATMDFRGCNRLSVLDLTGCTGISTIILPSSSTLTEVTLPDSITTLNMEYYPLLVSEYFNFNGTVSLLTIDARNDINFVTTVLDKYLQGATKLEITNIPSEGIWLPKSIVNKIAQISNLKMSGIIYVGDDPLATKSENNATAITWMDKKLYAQAFGDIDNNTGENDVKIIYKKVSISSVTIKATAQILQAQSSPIGLTITGNMIKIVGNNLAITYGSNNISEIEVDSVTGYVTPKVLSSEGVQLTAKVANMAGVIYDAVTATNQKYTLVKIGFYTPKIGDFAYADGHFDDYYDATSDIVGVVYYVKSFTKSGDSAQYYDVRVLGRQEISESTQGPISESGLYSTTETAEAFQVVASDAGLNDAVNIYIPYDTQSYGGTDYSLNANQINNTPETTSTITSTTADEVMLLERITSGYPLQQSAYNKGLSNFTKVKKYSSASANISSYSEVTAVNMSIIKNIMNNMTMASYSGKPFEAFLYPLAMRTQFYQPQSDNIADIYKAGNWYIPSFLEIRLLVSEKIRSVTPNKDDATYSFYDSIKYSTDYASDTYALFSRLAANLGSVDDAKSFTPFATYDTFVTAKIASNAYTYVYGKDWYTTGWKLSDWGTTQCNRVCSAKIVPCCMVILKKG